MYVFCINLFTRLQMYLLIQGYKLIGCISACKFGPQDDMASNLSLENGMD